MNSSEIYNPKQYPWFIKNIFHFKQFWISLHSNNFFSVKKLLVWGWKMKKKKKRICPKMSDNDSFVADHVWIARFYYMNKFLKNEWLGVSIYMWPSAWRGSLLSLWCYAYGRIFYPHSIEYCRNMSGIFPIFHCNWNIAATFFSIIPKYFISTLQF